MIETISTEDYNHLWQIAPTRIVKERNDKLWMLMLVSREPKIVTSVAMVLWQRNYPAAFRTALQAVNEGRMTVE